MAAIAHPIPFDYTKTGRLGDKRETMLQSELQLKPQLGQPLRRGYSIPEGYTFGRRNQGMAGGAGEALHGWASYYSKPMPEAPKPQECGADGEQGQETQLPFLRQTGTAPRDFVALNKAAVHAGQVKSNEQYQFRATHDIRQKVKGEDKQRSRGRRIPPTMVFGLSTRPSTPIYDLLEHKFQDQWLDDRRKRELDRRTQEDSKKAASKEVYLTRTCQLRTFQEPVQDQQIWKLPKFANKARPVLQTFRSAGARNAAYKHFDSDGVARRGTFNEGIYEPARS